jgi:Ca2+-binding EF-hand superfamily protein
LYDNRGDGRIPVSLIGDVIRALGQNPTEAEVKKLVHEHRADERVTFEVFLPILQVAICFKLWQTPDPGRGLSRVLKLFPCVFDSTNGLIQV